MRIALLAGAGSKCPTELANVAHHALDTGHREAVQREFEKLVSPPEALGRALLQEAALHPDQTAPSAVARAADAADQEARTSVRGGLRLRISGTFWRMVKQRPQGSQKQRGGKKRLRARTLTHRSTTPSSPRAWPTLTW